MTFSSRRWHKLVGRASGMLLRVLGVLLCSGWRHTQLSLWLDSKCTAKLRAMDGLLRGVD